MIEVAPVYVLLADVKALPCACVGPNGKFQNAKICLRRVPAGTGLPYSFASLTIHLKLMGQRLPTSHLKKSFLLTREDNQRPPYR